MHALGSAKNAENTSASGGIAQPMIGGDFNFNVFSSNKVQVDEEFLKEKLDLIKSDVLDELT